MTGVNRNILYRNRGDGTFEEVTASAGVTGEIPGRGKVWSVGAGWFDYNRPDEHRLVLLQGDTRHSGTPKDGVVARRQIAAVPKES